MATEGSLNPRFCARALRDPGPEQTARHRGQVLLEIHFEMQDFPKMCEHGRRTGTSKCSVFSNASLQIGQIFDPSARSSIETTGSDARKARFASAVDNGSIFVVAEAMVAMYLSNMSAIPSILGTSAIRDLKGTEVSTKIGRLGPVSDSTLLSPTFEADSYIAFAVGSGPRISGLSVSSMSMPTSAKSLLIPV